MSEQFSMTRLGYLLRSDLINRYRSVLMISATLAALMLVHGLLARNANVFSTWGFGMLFIWGPLAASRSFTELHDKTRNEAFLLLPASGLEKVASRLLLVTVGLGLYIVLFTNVVSWLGGGLRLALFGSRDTLFPIFGMDLTPLAFFLVQQSLFFLGAAWFRRNHFIKTSLVLTIGTIGLICFAMLVVRLFLPDLSDPLASDLLQIDLGAFYRNYEPHLNALLYLAMLLYFVVQPVFCWVLAWIRVRETQVSHGV